MIQSVIMGLETFGEWVKKRRKVLDLTQKLLAERIGCSVSAIRKIENDERRPSLQIAELMAVHLEIATEDRPAFLKIARRDGVLRGLNHLSKPAASVKDAATVLVSATTIPNPSTPFIGRQQEVASLNRMISDPYCRLITILGPGGIGKTRLALKAAADQIPNYGENIYFVQLSTFTSVDSILPAIAATLKIPSNNNPELKSRLISFLSEKSTLLVLDNFEHLSEGAIILNELLLKLPLLKLLVTSRERLNLQGEWTFELSGLSVPQSGDENAPSYSALQLFDLRAKTIRPEFELFGPERDAVIQICQQVDGMPLAIEMAAAYINVLSCREINMEIADSFEFLKSSLRDVSPRHTSLRAVFEYSWKRLTPNEQSALSQLALFQGGFNRQAALKITGSDIDVISSLISKSLLQRTETGRFTIHEVIRKFSLEYISNQEELKDRHSNYYLNLLRESESALFGEDTLDRLGDIRFEFGNIHLAWQHALENKRYILLNTVLPSLWMAYDIIGWLNEGVDLTGKLIQSLQLEQKQSDHKEFLGKTLAYYGMFVFRMGDYKNARDSLEGSIRLLRDAGSHKYMAPALIFGGIVVSLMGELPYARALMDEGVSFAISNNDFWFMALGQFDQGFIAGQAGQLDYAYERMQTGLAIWRELKNLRFISFALNFLSPIAIQMGHLQDAHSYLQESIQISSQLNDQWGLGTAIGRSGMLAILQGDVVLAKSLIEDSLAIFKNLGAKWDIAWALTQLGKVHVLEGNFTEGKQILKKAIRIAIDVNALPQALEATLEFTKCLIYEDKPAIALEIIIYVLKHPASTRITLKEAEELKKELQDALTEKDLQNLPINNDPEKSMEAIVRLLD